MTSRVSDLFDSLARTLAVVLIVALLATAGLWYALQRGSSREITAYFSSVVGLYTKNTVDVSGVPVGTVEEIVPQGNVVRVTLKVDNKVPISAGAQAVIVAPTLVSDRYVQLGPNYTGGPMMNDGAVIPVERTAVPVELDRVYKSLDTIATALGPNGADKNGGLNRLLTSSANTLGGNGEAIKQTITELAGAVGTLSDNRENLFATVDNLGQFTNMLARNDGQVRLLNNQLADFSGFLGERARQPLAGSCRCCPRRSKTSPRSSATTGTGCTPTSASSRASPTSWCASRRPSPRPSTWRRSPSAT